MTNNLERELLDSFTEVPFLGTEYSLADYDFFDTNRTFPRRGYAWIEANLKLARADLMPSHWPREELEMLDDQLANGYVLDKRCHWNSLTTDYLERHWCGLAHMERKPFLFYLPGWMHAFITDENPQKSLCLSSAYFFSKFSSLHFADEKYFSWMSGHQKSVLVDFLGQVRGEWEDEARLASIMWSSAI